MTQGGGGEDSEDGQGGEEAQQKQQDMERERWRWRLKQGWRTAGHALEAQGSGSRTSAHRPHTHTARQHPAAPNATPATASSH